MHGEEADEFLHPFVHRAVERRELLQVLTDQRLLLGVLLQKSFGDDKGDIVTSNADLLEPILHAPERVGDELKARIVEQAFLHACDEAEARAFADLTKLAEERKIEA